MLNRSGESGHLCLVPDLRGKAFSILLLNMMLAVALFYIAFIMFRYIPSLPNLLRNFHPERRLYFVKCFLCIYWDDHMIFVFYSINDLHILNHPCIPRINYIWSWCMILLMCYWIQFVNIKNFCIYIHQGYWPAIFFSYNVLFWLWHQGDADLIK